MNSIFVIGVYRSGTSAIAGVLHHLDVFMGEKFDPPNENNPKGYWEDLEFKEIHKEFDDKKNNYELVKKYKNLINYREDSNKIWGLKDPLLCNYLDYLTLYLKNQPKLIVCRRDRSHIAKSMAKSIFSRRNIESKYLDLMPLVDSKIELMNEQIYKFKGPILELDHESTLKNPDFHINRISSFINKPVTKKSLKFLSKSR